MRYLFTGDSITDAGRQSDPLRLGSGYVNMLAARLRADEPDAETVNTGISGNRIAHLRERLRPDVVDHLPDVATVLIGVNDILVAFFEGAVTPPDSFAADLAVVLDAMTREIPHVIVLEPFFIDSRDLASRWGDAGAFVTRTLAERRATIRDAAAASGARFVPLQVAFDAAVRARGTETVAYDGVHPSPVGHGIIADAWWEARS